MSYCKFCGAQMNENTNVCPACGKPADLWEEPLREKKEPLQEEQNPAAAEITENGAPEAKKPDGVTQNVTVNINNPAPQPVETEKSGLKTAAKVFMVLGIIASGWMLIPLAWTIPMTVSVFHDFRDGRPVGMGLKICSLLFVSLIGGILLLCINDKKTA